MTFTLFVYFAQEALGSSNYLACLRLCGQLAIKKKKKLNKMLLGVCQDEGFPGAAVVVVGGQGWK